MCDTVVVVRDGEVWFAKNSDRDPNEAQRIEGVAGAEHQAGASLRCTWITIPQARRTHRVLLSRPFWMWGAEMGANEHGVVIGNEAVFARTAPEASGLTGMDLVRLGLERSTEAAEAVEVITALLRAHGQGGRAGYSQPGFTYHNSFLVADASGAWVVETVGRETASERITAGARAISNGLTLPALTPQADRLKGWVAACGPRRRRVEALARQADSIQDLANVLRDHGEGTTEPSYDVIRGAMRGPCMHFGGRLAGSQTVGSWVSRLGPGAAHHWVTGTSAPCMSVFRPVTVEEPPEFGSPEGAPDGTSLWWRFEALHRRWLVDPSGLAQARRERDELERRAFEDPSDGRAHHLAADGWLSRHRALLDKPCGRDRRPRWLRQVWADAERQAQSSRLPAREVT